MSPAVTLALLATMAPRPGASCPVRLIPSDAPQAWASAASALERTLRDTAAAGHDCREIVVRAAATGATTPASVEVTTADGRRGVRTVADARDLEPTVAALIITIPTDPPAGPTMVGATARDAPVSLRDGWHLLLLVGTGARLTLPNGPAPVLDLMAGIVHRSLELALYGSWAPLVGAGAKARAGFSSTAEVGLGMATRHSIRSVDLIGGARVAGAGIWGYTRSDTGAMTGSASGSFGDGSSSVFVIAPVFSVFGGTSIPVGRALRVRPQLSLQWMPVTTSADESISDIWSLGLGLGFESGVP
jgi:hypothetical protein